MIFEGRVGPQVLSDGSVTGARLSKDAAVVTQDGHATFQEAVIRGNVYCVGDGTGGQNPSALSASPISVALYNPKGSQVNAVIWYAAVISTVAPAAIQAVWLGINNNIAAAATTGTALASKNCLAGSAKTGAVTPLTTATLPAAPVIALVLGATLTGAITTSAVSPVIGGFINGAVVLAPGSSASFQFSSISGAAGNFGSWIWEEVPA